MRNLKMLIREIENSNNNTNKVDQLLLMICIKYVFQLSEITSEPDQIVKQIKNGERTQQNGKQLLLSKTKLITAIFSNTKMWNELSSTADEMNTANAAWDRLEQIENNILDLIDTL